MPDIPKIISVDDHVVEPADVWQKRLPKKYLDVGPRVVRAPLGEMTFVGGNFSYEKGEGNPCDWWHYEDKKIPQTRLSAAVGFDRDEVKITAITYEEMRPGCYDPKRASRTWTSTGSRRRSRSRRFRASAGRRSWKPRTW